jgi:hypothetical protein
MKRLTFFVIALALLSACKSTTNEGSDETETNGDTAAVELSLQATENHHYGDTITEDDAIDVRNLLALMDGADSVQMKVRGVVNSSCTKKGCWMTMEMADGEELLVRFRDYGFFVPKNLDGEIAIAQGIAFVDTLDIPYLKHLAEDAGKSAEEIAEINEIEISVNFTADGVIVKS